jgi:hypothetical protein
MPNQTAQGAKVGRTEAEARENPKRGDLWQIRSGWNKSGDHAEPFVVACDLQDSGFFRVAGGPSFVAGMVPRSWFRDDDQFLGNALDGEVEAPPFARPWLGLISTPTPATLREPPQAPWAAPEQEPESVPESYPAPAPAPTPTKAKRTIVETVEDEVGEVKATLAEVAQRLNEQVVLGKLNAGHLQSLSSSFADLTKIAKTDAEINKAELAGLVRVGWKTTDDRLGTIEGKIGQVQACAEALTLRTGDDLFAANAKLDALPECFEHYERRFIQEISTNEANLGDLIRVARAESVGLLGDNAQAIQDNAALAVARITSVESKLLAEIRTWAFLFALGNAIAWLVLR